MASNRRESITLKTGRFFRGNWWHIIAAVPLFGIGEVILIWAGTPQAVHPAVEWAAFFFHIMVLALPVAFAIDVSFINDVQNNWSPDRMLWILVGVVGVLVAANTVQIELLYVLFAFCLWYLYRRHQYVGTP